MWGTRQERQEQRQRQPQFLRPRSVQALRLRCASLRMTLPWAWMSWRLVQTEVCLHAFEGLAFGFGVEEEDGEELYGHHGCEEGEGECLRVDRYQGESVRDDSVGDPVGRGA